MRSRLLIAVVGIFLCFSLTAVSAGADEVVVYTSLDQVFSQPILEDFEKDTGIKVKAVYDVEATKTTGLVNRLIAEKNRPQADVFWNSEVGRTLVLKEKEVLAPYHPKNAASIPSHFKDDQGYWTGFAARCRVLIYNTDMLSPDELPSSIFELTDPRWKGKVTMAYPLFGTTATHVAALYAELGREKTEDYLKDLKDNDVVIVDGNSTTRDIVVRGEVPIGFTDTDDANVAISKGQPVEMMYPDKDGLGTLFIPNTVALVKNSPNPEQGKQLIEYLLSREVEKKLAFSPSAQIPLRKDVEVPDHVPGPSAYKAMEVDYQDIADNLEESAEFCRDLFVR
ncbi:MAG: extracellular solute-binding protein [Desulfobacteraceae bacterium]|nr:extracellular solute-binding protein [Desulfobacteraceae bacterium]